MPRYQQCLECGSRVELKSLAGHMSRHEKDKLLPRVSVKCLCCGETKESEHGSSRFCSRKCGRSYSTKEKRQEINDRLRISCTKTRKCEKCLRPYTKKKRQEKKRVLCPECWLLAAEQRMRITREARSLKMREVAIRRIDAGERWFGTQTAFNYRGATITCDSLLERACLMMIEAEWSDVVSLRRCDFWISYNMPGEPAGSRRYNPDFIVEFSNRRVIVEVKSERMCNSDTWEDYREKALVKHRVLAEYASLNGYETFWCTQRTCKKYYSKVLSDAERPVKRRKAE